MLTIIPVAFAALLLGYTIWQIYTAQKKLTDTESALNIKITQLAGAENELSQKRTQVPQAEATLNTAQENLSQVKMDLATAAVQAGQLQEELATATAQIEQLNSKLENAQVYVEHACPINKEALKVQSGDAPQDFFFCICCRSKKNILLFPGIPADIQKQTSLIRPILHFTPFKLVPKP